MFTSASSRIPLASMTYGREESRRAVDVQASTYLAGMEMLSPAERLQLAEFTDLERDVLCFAATANHTRASLAGT